MTALRADAIRVELGIGASRRTVLDGVSLDVPAGVAVAVMGASGSGKSTLLLALAGLERVVAGRIAWDDATLRMGRRGRRRGIAATSSVAVVPQRAESALAGERVDGDVGMVLRLRGAAPALEAAAVDAALERCALGGALRHRDPLRLSGGEQRRVAIAAAVAHGPGALLLDEPTAGLDAAARGAIARLVVAEAAAGHAVVVATHDPELVLATCSHLVVLERGRVAWAGPPTRLLADAARCRSLGIGAPPAVEVAARVAQLSGRVAPRTCDVDQLSAFLAEVAGVGTAQG